MCGMLMLASLKQSKHSAPSAEWNWLQATGSVANVEHKYAMIEL